MHSLTLDKHKNFLNNFISLDKLLSLDTRGFAILFLSPKNQVYANVIFKTF